MSEATPASESSGRGRLLWFFVVAGILSLVCDGWSSKPSPFIHQLLLIPAAVGFTFSLVRLLNWKPSGRSAGLGTSALFALLAVFEALALALVVEESRHFRQFGYHLGIVPGVAFAVTTIAAWSIYMFRHRASTLMLAVLATYSAGVMLAIACFPLNYLRSDMLPVIQWADARLLTAHNPYDTIRVGARLYDFPYLPGMLLGFLPAIALHLDPRFVSLFCIVGIGILLHSNSRPERRVSVGIATGGLVLCPYLQYRHDLYLQPHWVTLVLAGVLMARRRYLWSAFVWGVSCGIYQLSWVLMPFVLLFAWRRGGLREAIASAISALGGAALVLAPFLPFAMHRIASNTVGQWSKLPHALADPINLSYWLTFVIRPDELRWVQAGVLTVLFCACVWYRRCSDMTDTFRWMAVALTIFIALNVLVDGYFYLTLLVVLLLFICSANKWWLPGPESATPNLP